MKPLAFGADIILPNITEACFLTETEYRDQYDEAYIAALLDRLTAAGAKTIVLTGVGYRPDQSLSEAFEGAADKVISIGDCTGIGNIIGATTDAYEAVWDL